MTVVEGAAPGGDGQDRARERHMLDLLGPPRRTFMSRYEYPIITALSLIIVFGLWQAAVDLGFVRRTFLPAPTDVGRAAVRLIASGELWRHFSFSALNFVIGFALAAIIAVPLGLVMGTRRRIAIAVAPYILTINAAPRIAFISLLIIWFGLGIESKIILIVLSSFFPIVINAWTGARVVDPVLMRAGTSYGASGWRLFWHVIIPFSLPFIMAGLRQGVGRGIVGIVGSELFGTNVGIGYLIITSGFNFRIPDLFVGVLVLAFIGIVGNELIELAERRMAPWRQPVNET
jgi:ABC-type nitrate/sulfonate/bicarbonate transport system permease component